jgi:biopolymer transport protein ExbD
MSEILVQDNPRRKGGLRSKKLSTRVDLTPMVDLGFLLITFFIFTTTLSRPAAMNLILPADGTGNTTAASKTMNVILSPNNQIVYYRGNNIQLSGKTDFSATGIRSVLLEAKKSLPNSNDLVVLIKPGKDASYQNIVAMLDEMQISGIKKYVLMDMSESEKVLFK